MVDLAANPRDSKAEAVVNTDRFFHSNLRTTCVATLLDGGHAPNALPQRAGANVNCRIFPGHSIGPIPMATASTGSTSASKCAPCTSGATTCST